VAIAATALAITGVAVPGWVQSTVGDATVYSGLWVVCSSNVPFLTDGCDGIIEPASNVMGARVGGILSCVLGLFSIISSALTIVVFPYSIMLFLSLLVQFVAGVVCLLSVISFGERLTLLACCRRNPTVSQL
jgi:hypothetical protein